MKRSTCFAAHTSPTDATIAYSKSREHCTELQNLSSDSCSLRGKAPRLYVLTISLALLFLFPTHNTASYPKVIPTIVDPVQTMGMRCTRPWLAFSLACFIAVTLSMPQTLCPNPSTIVARDTGITCTKPRLFKLRPHFGDCIKAIQTLSDNAKQAEFHYGSRGDIYQLPVTGNYGGCDVRIDLGYSRQPEETSYVHCDSFL